MLRSVFSHVADLDCRSIFVAKIQGSKVGPGLTLLCLRKGASNERACDPGPTVTQSAMAEAGQLGSERRRWSLPGLLRGDSEGERALSYAQQRARYSPTEIQLLDAEWNFAEIVPLEDKRALV